MSMKFKLGLCGLGTVGRGVVDMLTRNGRTIAERTGLEFSVTRVLVRDPAKERDLPPGARLTFDYRELIEDPEVDIVVEVMGGRDTALEVILGALRGGKSVVTANKEVMASFGPEVFAAAREHGADLFFEASVGGGIPLIRPLKQCLVGNEVSSLLGILNGTSNYILTRMAAGVEFSAALREAQQRGYAEADPRADLEGHDAARKLAILAAVAFGARVKVQEVYTEGIGGLEARDVEYAARLGWAVKPLVMGDMLEGRLSLRVYPALLPLSHPLAKVDGAFNAVLLEGDFVGRTLFYGQGAGGAPTASAVVGDIIEAARNRLNGHNGVGCTCRCEVQVADMAEHVCQHYLRFVARDVPGVLGRAASVLGACGVNIHSVLQTPLERGEAELVFVTHPVREGSLREALAELRREVSGLTLRTHLRLAGVAEL